MVSCDFPTVWRTLLEPRIQVLHIIEGSSELPDTSLIAYVNSLIEYSTRQSEIYLNSMSASNWPMDFTSMMASARTDLFQISRRWFVWHSESRVSNQVTRYQMHPDLNSKVVPTDGTTATDSLSSFPGLINHPVSSPRSQQTVGYRIRPLFASASLDKSKADPLVPGMAFASCHFRPRV